MKSALDVTVSTEYYKVLVIGSPGTGKSVFASTFPTKGYVFDFSGGIVLYRGLDFDYEQFPLGPQGWVQLEKEFKEVGAKVANGEYETVVLDDMTGMMDIAMERSLQLDPKRNAAGGPLWNVHYQMVRNLIEGKLRQVLSWNCNIIVIAHMDVTKDEETGAILEVKPLMTGQLAIRMPGYFDEVYYTSTKKEGERVRYLIQTISIGLKNARSRLSGKEGLLPYFVDNDYKEIMAYLTGAKKKQPLAK
jgi:hypothetical protein